MYYLYSTTKQKKASISTVQKEEENTPTSPNLTGIPDGMKTRFENLSGFSFDDVRVHYNSDKPAQLQALAYTQGNQVYVASGQEKHLPHELGHVIQQKKGMVRPTSIAAGMPLNDDPNLEQAADRVFQHTSKIIFENNAASPKKVTQLLRKRVQGSGATVNNTDIFYSKTDGEYYTGMSEVGQAQASITEEEYARFTTFRGKTRSSNTMPLVDATKTDRTEIFMRSIGQREEAQGHVEGIEISPGYIMDNPPPAIRLYAEGDMDHATTLSRQMISLDNDRGFMDMLSGAPALSDSLPVIKATEFDTLDNVQDRRHDGLQLNQRIQDATLSNLEMSFGERTGNFVKE